MRAGDWNATRGTQRAGRLDRGNRKAVHGSRSVLVAVVVAALLASGQNALAEEVVRNRFSLPLEGMAVDISSLAGPGTEPVRITVTGTVTSSIDGSEIDALSRRLGSVRYESEGPFVRFPAGSRVVESDPEIHRYTIEVPRQPFMPLSVNLAPLAARHLVTHSELVASCTGALEVEVLGAPVPTMAGSVEELTQGSLFGMVHAVAISIIGLLLLVGVGVSLSRRWGRARPERALIRRAKVAVRAVERESRAMGPAFDHVVATASQLLGTALIVREHLVKTRAALRKTRSLQAQGAAAQRRVLQAQQIHVLAGLAGITERLEETAADLAARGTDRHRARGADDPTAIIAALEQEVDSAVAATREAELAAL